MAHHGFTLVELLIVIAMVGILAALLIPNLIGARRRGHDTTALACAKSLELVQGISQMDTGQYALLGTGTGQINRNTDGVHAACKAPTMFITDRSDPSTLTTSYRFDVWDTRGSRVITVSPIVLNGGVSGATPFSDTGAGGTNLP